jgi:hypothetical protein
MADVCRYFQGSYPPNAPYGSFVNSRSVALSMNKLKCNRDIQHRKEADLTKTE